MTDFAWDTLFTNGALALAFVFITLGFIFLLSPRPERGQFLVWQMEAVGIVLSIALAYGALLALCAGLTVRGC